MKTPNTFAASARKNRIISNSRIVTDDQGSTLRITRSRRVLAIRREMSGKWEAPTMEDGFESRHGNYYVTGRISEACDTEALHRRLESARKMGPEYAKSVEDFLASR